MPTIFCIPPPPIRLHLEQHVVWCFHFIRCPLILTVVCLTVLERSMVCNNSGHLCFEIGILHIHRNHQSIIAIITVISISIVLSAIVVALSSPLPTYRTSSTSSTSSSNSSILIVSLIGGSRDVLGICPSMGPQFFHFCIHFHQKHPCQRSMPP